MQEAAEYPLSVTTGDGTRVPSAEGCFEPKVLWKEVSSNRVRLLLPVRERGCFRDVIARRPLRFLAKPVLSSRTARFVIGVTWLVWAFSTLPHDDLG